jgi:hypothetical protein
LDIHTKVSEAQRWYVEKQKAVIPLPADLDDLDFPDEE